MERRIDHQPPLALTESNVGASSVVELPAVDFTDSFFRTLRRRRSHRAFAGRPLRLVALARVLAAGLAITDFATSRLSERGLGPLPLKPTPSGGARNPYEAYVVVRAVDGLEAGVYHYAGGEHTLGRRPGTVPPFSRLLGGQEWFDAAAAVVFLVASFARTAWKYPHPTAYRVVLMEAGHIAQNLLLAATREELAAAPTAAIHDGVVERLLGLSPPLQSAVYAVVLGERGEGRSVADFPRVTPNPVFGAPGE